MKRGIPEEVLAMARNALVAMANLMSRESDTCPRCGQTLTGMEQIGRCVYGKPCGCRLWQGEVPEAWR